MKTFEEIKAEILRLGTLRSACSGEFARAVNSTNIDELMQVVKDNFSWCYNNGIATTEILDAIGESKVNEFGIYYKGEVERLKDLKGLYFCGAFKVKYLENSQVSEMWGNSQVSVMRGNSQVSVMRENSQVSVMWENSQVSEMRENSQVSVMRENSQVSVMWENSQVSEMRENSFARSYNANLPKEAHNRYCYMDLKNNIVYIGKDLRCNAE